MTLLELAENYYAVARDLEDRARRQLDMAKYLAQCADQMCEQNIRNSTQQEQQS